MHVYIASLNTRASTELTIRTALKLAGHSFRLTVGDGGSVDGSVEMLRSLEADGLLDLELAEQGKSHADWLDHWLSTCRSDFACFVDSDVEFLRRRWLGCLLDVAADTPADLVYAEVLAGSEDFVMPWTGEKVRLAPRPAPWLFLARVETVRAVGVSFAEHVLENSASADEKTVYDVGGWFHQAASSSGLRSRVMPRRFGRWYRHLGGTSWRAPDDGRSRLAFSNPDWIESGLREARAWDDGRVWEARRRSAMRRLRLSAETKFVWLFKALNPHRVRARLARRRDAIPWG